MVAHQNIARSCKRLFFVGIDYRVMPCWQNPMPTKEKIFQFARKKSVVDNYLPLLLFKGTLGFLWFFAWMYFVHDTPREHPTISKEELEYIETTVGKEQDHLTPKDQVQY